MIIYNKIESALTALLNQVFSIWYVPLKNKNGNGGEKMYKTKKEYLPADITLIEFDKSDVITTSSWGLPYVDPDENAWV